MKLRLVCTLLLVLVAGCPDKSPPKPVVQTFGAGPAALGSGAVTTASGLRYEDVVSGTGPMPKNGQTVIVHYHGRLTDGTVFDSSRERGTPFDFQLGEGMVIKGWDEGVATMKVGGVRRLVIPPELGYGSARAPGGKIPPNSTLVFDVELLAIK
jgi:peptidylprolyl isomerase